MRFFYQIWCAGRPHPSGVHDGAKYDLWQNSIWRPAAILKTKNGHNSVFLGTIITALKRYLIAWITCIIHRVSKKGSHQTFANNFLKFQLIFEILSLLDRGWIFPTKLRNIFHHTLIMLLHYLGKVNSSNLLQITTEKKIKKRVVFDKNETFMLSYSWLEIGVLFYSIYSKCPPFTCTHARKRLCHSSMHCQWCSGRRYATFCLLYTSPSPRD